MCPGSNRAPACVIRHIPDRKSRTRDAQVDNLVALQQRPRQFISLQPRRKRRSPLEPVAICRRRLNSRRFAMLKGKTAVVTGSTSGIGLGIARALAKQGSNVVINGFGDKADVEKERSGLEREFGVKAIYSAADMTKPAEIAAMIADAEKALGSVDVLVNYAGI